VAPVTVHEHTLAQRAQERVLGEQRLHGALEAAVQRVCGEHELVHVPALVDELAP